MAYLNSRAQAWLAQSENDSAGVLGFSGHSQPLQNPGSFSVHNKTPGRLYGVGGFASFFPPS